MGRRTSQYSLHFSMPDLFDFLYGKLITLYLLKSTFLWSTNHLLSGQLDFFCGYAFILFKVNFRIF